MARQPSPWEPMPCILYGYAVHPLSPGSKRDTARMSTRTRMSAVSENTELQIFKDVVELEVGDEIYAFERYIPRGKEVDGIWYRGYVVTPARRPAVSWPTPSEVPIAGLNKTEEPQQVTLGIFPASHIHIRDERADAEGRLAVLARAREDVANGTLDSTAWRAMDTLREEDEDVDPALATNGTGKASFRLPPPPDQAQSSRGGLTVYPASIRSRSSSPSLTEAHVSLKPLPPRPTLKGGDETASGIAQPLVDEIAAALREWHARMFTYLARREYELFHIVRGHIESLHLGRRQLLAQTLSAEETMKLRRDCVTRLVRGNITQGLDIIVRHPTWGALVTVDIDGELDRRSWVSAVRMYALQVSLAYLDTGADVATPQPSSRKMSMESLSMSPSPTPAGSSFSELVIPKGSSLGSFGASPVQPIFPIRSPGRPPISRPVKFYHVFLDLRAFVASICTPNEVVELFFSLYNQAQTRFVTEEFCAVLNHHGVLARDPNAKIRTLFTDLVQSDVQDPIFLVCRIVRNGGLKIGSNMSTGVPSDVAHRSSEASSVYEASINGGRAAGEGSATYFRRPFGCAVLELSQLSEMANERADMSATKEYTMPIYMPTNEAVYSMMHQDVIANKTREFEKSSRAEMLAVSVKIFRGEAETIVRENVSLLQDTPLSLRLGFPDVVFPGDERNEVYIKLWSGDFTSNNTSSARLSMAGLTRGQVGPQGSNVLVTMEVRDFDGRVVRDAISMGSGEPPLSQFHSMVFQKNSQPTYGELVKLRLPSRGPPQWHLFFTFRHRGQRDAKTSSKSDAQERPFAFAFLPLFPERWQFLKDGAHTLVLYRVDRGNPVSPELYLNASSRISANQHPDEIQVPADMMRVAPPLRDSVTLRTSLCSTRFTQEPQLMKLLNWQQISESELPDILARFTFVGEMEIVKFLRDIFDALFGILVSEVNSSGSMDNLIFNALIIVLGTVQDRRFSNFQPVLDVYIEEHFNHPSSASRMIRSMNRLLVEPAAAETASQLRAALKVWHYIFKFVARSREIQKLTAPPPGNGTDVSEAAFRRDLRTHLSEVNNMMSATTPPSIIGTQTIALQHFTSILPELAKIFSNVELVTIATTFAGSIVGNNGKIHIWKLIMHLQLVKGFLFEHSHSRSLLVEAVVVWIKPYFGRFDEYGHSQLGDPESAVDNARIRWLESTRLCVTTIAVMLDKLHQCLIDPEIVGNRALYRREQENVEYILSLLPRLVASYAEFRSPASQGAVERTHSAATIVTAVPITFPESYPFSLVARSPTRPQHLKGTSDKDNDLFNPGLGEIAVVLLALIMASPKKHILDFLETNLEIEGRENFTSLVSQTFQVAISMLHNDAFPRNWLNINVLIHTVLIKLMDPVAVVLENRFVPDHQRAEQLDAGLWRGALLMLLSLLSSDQLIIEDLGPQKGRTVWRLASDVRGEGATILLRLWDALGLPDDATASAGAIARFGGYQAEMSNLVGHVVNLCLSHHDQLRTNAVQMLYTMILSEFHLNEHFDDIENEVVNKLDSLFMSDSKGDEMSKTLFLGQLRQLFIDSQVDERLAARVAEFLNSVESFLELLLSVRALPDGEEFADDRVMATLRLMNFIRRIGRDEMYIKYVHQLVNIHLQSQNYVEAALTLQLHADLHEWDLHSFVSPLDDLGLPQQSHFHRKETLYLLIVDYLGKGKAWEKAIELCRELADQHQNVTFNYGRLAEIIKHQAKLYEHIISEQRYYPDYFKVSYYGDFPAAIRSKHVIFRGYEWEKFGAFCERMLNKHPGARLLKGFGDPPPDIRFGTDQYIQCSAVVPEPNRDHPIFSATEVPSQVKAYYEHSATNLFCHSRMVTRTGRHELEETWEEKTYFTTDATFPTVLKRSEVVDVQVLLISPIDNALTDVENKTRDLAGLYVKFSALSKTGQPVSTNALSMALNEAVDTPGQGVPAFRQMFLTPDYAERNPDWTPQIEKLSKAIEEHVFTIETCLRLHGQMCPPEMLPFHETLEKFFRKNFYEEIQRLAMDGLSDLDSIAPPHSFTNQISSQYPHSLYGDSSKVSISSGTANRPAVTISSVHDRAPLSPPPLTPSLHSMKSSQVENASDYGSITKVTPLKRTLAHLARHGLNGVTVNTDAMSADATSVTTPTATSFINVGDPAPPIQPTQSTPTSLKGRLSRLGSLSFGRREG